MRARIWAASFALLGSVAAASCTNDYDQFDLGGGQGGDGAASDGSAAAGGTAGSAAGGGSGTGGSSTGGSSTGGSSTGGSATGGGSGVGGGSGGGASGNCGTGQKPCGAGCVPDDDPATGCAQASCDACTVANGVATCAAGACAVQSCNAGFGDCNDGAGDGCEVDLGQPNDTSCGSCDNDCTAQGFSTNFSCGVDLLCRCTSADQCRSSGGGSVTCTAAGRCTCDGSECNPGEECRKTGPNQVCSCNGGAACIPGRVCCQTPAGCFDLQNDSNNCGACGKVCPSGTQCSAGTCS